MALLLEALTSEEGKDLSLQNNFSLLYCAFPDNPSKTDSSTLNIFCLWLKIIYKVVATAILATYAAFLSLFYVRRRYTCY